VSLTTRCRTRLQGVHPDLVRVVEAVAAESPHEIFITEGLRTKARQQQLVAAGASRTMNSRHLTGHAIDFAVRVAGQVRWDWPLYQQVGEVFERVAARLGVPIVWGGRWRTFRDGPHVELDRRTYP